MMIGLLVLLTNTEQHTAQGTSLLAMFPMSIRGVFTHYKLKTLDVRVGEGLAIGSIIGAMMGATIANMLMGSHLRIIFAIVGIWMGLRYLFAR